MSLPAILSLSLLLKLVETEQRVTKTQRVADAEPFEWLGIVNMAARTGNLLCSACRSEPCTMYCTCATAPIYLCEDCFMPHCKKNPRLVHTMVPVEVGDISQYQTRCKALADASEELLQNLTRIDQCCAEVSAVVDTLITRAQEFRDQFITQMKGLKDQVSREIYASLAEAEGSLEQDNVQFQSAYSKALRNYTTGSLSFFSFKVESSTIERFLQSLVTTENKDLSCNTDKCLFWVESNEIKTFNTATLQTGPAISLNRKIERNYDANSRFVVWEDDKLVLCGGKGGKKSAFLLNTRTGTVETLPDMLYGRSNSGMVVYRGYINVFGSYSGDGLARCERLQLNPAEWGALPDMHRQRSCFTPALWLSAVYLCGGLENNTTVEVFDGVSIALVNVTLPEGKQSLACVQGNQLFIISQCYFTTLSARGSTASIQVTAKARKKSGILSPANPVLLGNIILQFTGTTVRRYSVEDGSELE